MAVYDILNDFTQVAPNCNGPTHDGMQWTQDPLPHRESLACRFVLSPEKPVSWALKDVFMERC